MAGLGLVAPLARAQQVQPDTSFPEASGAFPQSESDRRAEIRRTLDQRPRKGIANRDDSRNRLSDEERRTLRKDIGDAVRDVYDKKKRKNGSHNRSTEQ